MKIETPQLLWNSEADKRLNVALMSIDMLESGIVDNDVSHKASVLATAGNCKEINLWRVSFDEATNEVEEGSSTMFQRSKEPKHCKLDYLCTLARHEGPVNAVAFSPDGLHLATAGETGTVIVWSVPVHKRGNGNGRHYWSTVTDESQLSVKIVSGGDAVLDISWSADSKRFVGGTIDHSIFVVEDIHYDANHNHTTQLPAEQQQPSQWKIVERNGMDHSQFVQGVAYDPMGVYLASMSSDRTVRVYPRKTPPKSKKKVLRPSHCTGAVPPESHQRFVQDLLTNSKLDFGRSKLIKYRQTIADAETGAVTKQPLFCDEATLGSFFRRLAWTTDGAYLVTPAALWRNELEQHSYATCLYARHKFDEPARVLTGLEKPSVAVRPNPVLFELPEEAKENKSPRRQGLPYRSVFCVLTHDTVLVYDTHHAKPLSIVRGLHYCNLSDATWSADGTNLLVSSTDGYISVIRFSPGELGQVYTPLPEDGTVPTPSNKAASTTTSNSSSPMDSLATITATPAPTPVVPKAAVRPLLPPCEPGSANVEAPPSKKAKKVRITPTLVAPSSATKRPAQEDAEHVEQAVDKLSLNATGDESGSKPKKKKRVQPVLLSTMQ